MSERFLINGKKVALKSLEYNSKDNQIMAMRNWFFQNYEDPVHACPYNSREGGYAYIFGGPYDADEELQGKFGGFVRDDIIQELADELQSEGIEWSGNSNNPDWYEDDVYDAVISSDSPFTKFVGNIEGIKALANADFKGEIKDHLLSLLYVNVITALETLYVELFINSIEKDESYISEYIGKGKSEFKVSKEIAALPFKGESIEKVKMELLKSITEHLISSSWHSPDRVLKRFKATFGINWRKEWSVSVDEIEIATLKRNHLVHRGGKDKEGKIVLIKKEVLDELLTNAMTVGENLNSSLNEALGVDSSIEDTGPIWEESDF
ncbi:hypothetical protein [Pantoea agglomerans]|uniref:hypothetical protein n=1 Tax=Enterobacter agglomerans TaxID=549 RepID=UPI001303D1E5|nr:hypothetical protein [Pantoea agglomerans]